MPKFPDIKQALRTQDIEVLTTVVPDFIRDESDGFTQALQQMMYLTANEQYGDGHPTGLVYLDAVRDLSTLYEQDIQDAIPLMEHALRFFCTLELQEWDKDLVGVKPEHFGESVFVGDLSEYVRDGEREKAIEESSKLLRMMDNQFYLVEILTEIAASTNAGDGWPVILADAALKSVDFVESSQFKPIVYQLTDYLSRLNIGWGTGEFKSDPTSPMTFDRYYDLALTSGDENRRELLLLTHTQQVWEGVRMKQGEIRARLAYWFDERFGEFREAGSVEYEPKSAELSDIVSAIRNEEREKALAFVLGYLQNAGGLGILFRGLTDIFLERAIPEDPDDLIHWNALRTAIAYTSPPQQYQAFVRAVEMLMDMGNRE
ncbi:MAG: hypothetical protein K9N46_17205 [Candidatus Marinimicrobia bacterium]|nr:hypothetical protein [Candidatus Neomarinimicrobiota bacterium]MCF7830311.1 hypothetical protein [Candidatus Neomarinimicrobiota bacterium]MCF7882467.1 hypothetical protein [Candidatus Neomarinimicrobiota bacterium]